MADNKIGIIRIGDKIEILKKDSIKKDSFPSQILDILENDEFIVSGPMKKHNLIFIHKNEIITIAKNIENKGRYEFDAIVLDRYIGKIYKIKLKKISEVRRKQLRRFYRFNISIPVNIKFTVIENGEEKVIFENSRTKDISGGGLKLLTNYSHNVDDIIECEFSINEKLIHTKAKVVRIESIDAFNYKFCLAVQFIDIDEYDRDVIIKYIFSKQRELRSKGLI